MHQRTLSAENVETKTNLLSSLFHPNNPQEPQQVKYLEKIRKDIEKFKLI